MDPVVAAILRGGLGVVLLTASAHKLRDIPAFRAAVAEYRLLPEAVAGLAAVLLVLVEVGAALALLVPIDARPAAALAAALLALYTSAIAINLARGRRDLDCGCAGPARRQPIGGALVARNLVLLAAALACALPIGPRALGWVDVATVVVAVATLALLYSAVEQLLATGPARERLRAEVAPELAAEGGEA